MKLVRESLASFERGRDPMTSIGIGIEAAVRRIKEEIKWRIEDDQWDGPGMLKFDSWELEQIYKNGDDLDRMAIKKILEEFLSGKKKWRKHSGGFISNLLNKFGLLWDPKYMWPTPNNVDYVRNIDPEKFDEFISKYWKPNQIYSAGVKYENVDLMKKGIYAGATNLEIGGSQPFITAAERGDLELMELLLQNSPNDPAGGTKDDARYNRDSDKDMTNAPIRIAARNGYINIVRLLMKDPRVDPSAANNFALNWSYYGGHKDVAMLLLTDKRVRDKVDLMPKTRQKDLRSAGLIESENFRRGIDPSSAMKIGTKSDNLKVYMCGNCGNITDSMGRPLDVDSDEWKRSRDIIEKMDGKSTEYVWCEECIYNEEMEAQAREEERRQEEEERWQCYRQWQWEQDNYDQDRY